MLKPLKTKIYVEILLIMNKGTLILGKPKEEVKPIELEAFNNILSNYHNCLIEKEPREIDKEFFKNMIYLVIFHLGIEKIKNKDLDLLGLYKNFYNNMVAEVFTFLLRERKLVLLRSYIC